MFNSTYLKQINTLPPFIMTDGTLEALKWLAMISMTIDHVNRFFYGGSVYAAFCAGRLAMPLFSVVLAYNLARPGILSRGVPVRVLKRLAFFGLLATPAYIAMRHFHWLPLNIMFTLWVATALIFLCEKGGILNILSAIFLFLISGFFVEYNWLGLIFCMTAWFYCKKPTIIALIGCLFAYAMIEQLNGNNWAMVTLPILAVATQIDLKIPRIPHFFYFYYPFHLTALFLIKEIVI